MQNGAALGANARPQRSILDVTAGEDLAAPVANRRTDAEAGIRRMRVPAHGTRGGDQSAVGEPDRLLHQVPNAAAKLLPPRRSSKPWTSRIVAAMSPSPLRTPSACVPRAPGRQANTGMYSRE